MKRKIMSVISLMTIAALCLVLLPVSAMAHEDFEIELGWPVYAGIINGVGKNKFDPDGQLTTEQAIVISYRAFESFSM